MQIERIWDRLEKELPIFYGRFRGQLEKLKVTSKQDQTLLSEADIEIQDFIISAVLDEHPDAEFIAEEQTDLLRNREYSKGSGHDVWIIDPIDGTKEFLSPTKKEFCSVVCLVRDLEPKAAFILAPELGRDSDSISVRASGSKISINGMLAKQPSPQTTPKRASVTRSSNTVPRSFEDKLLQVGWKLKVRTTSQTIDMLRTCVDLGGHTDEELPSFDLFFREDQKIWDGAAGMCLSRALGWPVVDRNGASLLPYSKALLSTFEPTIDSIVTGPPGTTKWFLRQLGSGPSTQRDGA
jgi:3'(2'), 5'-bisphosphate nucleotidase